MAPFRRDYSSSLIVNKVKATDISWASILHIMLRSGDKVRNKTNIVPASEEIGCI